MANMLKLAIFAFAIIVLLCEAIDKAEGRQEPLLKTRYPSLQMPCSLRNKIGCKEINCLCENITFVEVVFILWRSLFRL